MAQSQMKAPKRLGEYQTITSSTVNGWEAPSDGFVLLGCNSSGGINYLYTNVGNISMSGGLKQEATFPVRKGTVIKYSGSADSNRVWIQFMPIFGGGNCKVTPCNVAQVAA